MTALYQNRQILNLERRAVDEGYNEAQLMLNAGKAALKILHREWPSAHSICVIVGKGNNGGDGLTLAKLAHEKGFSVAIYSMVPIHEQTELAQKAAQSCLDVGLSISLFSPGISLKADVIIDALLGSGLKGELSESYVNAIQMVNQSGLPVLSLDLPSGLHGDTGYVQNSAVKATVTISFIKLKVGLFTGSASAYCGKIFLDPLGLPPKLFSSETPFAELLNEQLLPQLLPKRDADTHKGDYGHTLIVGGDYGMGGAVRMAAEAAMRVGSGLVTVATRPEHVPIVNCSRPEIMCHEVAGPEGLEDLLTRASVLVIGPGLGKSSWSRSLFDRLLESKLPKLLDADALNLLSESPRYSDDWILTPHPGEAASLLGTTVAEVQKKRFEALHELQRRYGGVIVLKGPGTLIGGPDQAIRVCPAGNPGMASGGMGDLLSGVIGGLMAQGLSLWAAAQAGVLIHSMGADFAAREGGERGLLATDLLCHIRRLANPIS